MTRKSVPAHLTAIMNELSTIIVSVLGTLAPLLGGGVWMYRRQTKRIKEAAARLAEVNVDKAKVETRADEWHLWKEQAEAMSETNKALIESNKELIASNREKEDAHQQDIKDWEQRFDSQTDRLRNVQRELIAANEREKEHIRREARLEKERDYYEQWKCYREFGNHKTDPEKCGRRKPQQKIPLHYAPLDRDSCETCETTHRCAISTEINTELS